MGKLVDELSAKFGYKRVRSWGEFFTGGWGRIERLDGK